MSTYWITAEKFPLKKSIFETYLTRDSKGHITSQEDNIFPHVQVSDKRKVVAHVLFLFLLGKV